VLVHDAARCLLRAEWVERLIDACAGDAVGGLLALPLADTLKAEADGRAQATIDRRAKWAAQTPQMFRLGLLARALAAAGAQVTDEAGAVEALGLAPRLVPGEFENFKVTYPADFALAERLLRSAQRGTELRPVLPVADVARACAFYAELGFQCEFAQGDLAGLRLGDAALLLQRRTGAAPAAPPVLHLTLADLDAFWARLQRDGVLERHGARAEPPSVRPWGRKDMRLTDADGSDWRIAQRLELPQ
jgi:uncharacterized glyoxalase superfamily protein PhnB